MRYLALALPLIIACGGGRLATDECEPELSSAQQRLVNGTPDLQDPLVEELSEHVVAISVYDQEADTLRVVCSGTYLGTGWVLTAAHCFPDASPTWLTFGRNIRSSCTAHNVHGVEVHPDADLALVRVEDAPRSQQVALATTQLAIDTQVVLAGYGADEAGDRGQRLFAHAAVTAADEDWITVQAERGGPCAGDSGGPLLLMVDGRATVGGVLSAGSYSCRGPDYYVSVAHYADWLTSVRR